MASVSRQRLVVSGLLVLLVFSSFLGALGNEFVWDDRGYILDTPELRHPSNIRLILDPELYFVRFQEGSWRPLVTLSHFLAVGLFGYWPLGHNLLDLLLYAIVVLLVYWIGLRLGLGESGAFVASALFAVHPVHVEPVVVSALRADLLCTIFMLLALEYLVGEEGLSPAKQALGLLFFGLALLSKEVALVFPLIVMAYDLSQVARTAKRPQARTLLYRYGAMVGLTALYAWLRFGPFAGPPRTTPYIGGSVWTASKTMLAILTQYARLLFWPLRLNADYVVRPVESLLEPQALAGLVILSATFGLMIASFRRRPALGFSLALMLLGLVPVANLVPLDNPMAERYLFFPSIGFSWALGLAAEGALRKASSLNRDALAAGAVWATFGLVITALGLRTALRTYVWHDELTLWQETVSASPKSARAQLNLGSALLLKGRWKEARQALERSLALEPDSAETLHNIGLIEAHEGRWFEAEQAYRRSLALQPDAPPTLYNLARALAAQGKVEEAKASLKQALARKPLFSDAYIFLGNLLMMEKRPQEALEAYRKATRADPEDPRGFMNSGNALRQLRRLKEAEKAYRRAIELDSRSAEAHFNLAGLLAEQGRLEETIHELEKSLKIDPKLARAHKNLGILYLTFRKEPWKARFHLERFLELRPDDPEAQAIKELLERLKTSPATR